MFSLIECKLKISATLAVCYLGVFFSACYSLYLTQLEVFSKLILYIVLVLMFAVFFVGRVLLLSRDSVYALSWFADRKQMVLYLKHNEQLEVTAIRNSVVTPFFVFLRLEVKERYCAIPLLILYDSCNSEAFRRLKVLAKFANYVDAD